MQSLGIDVLFKGRNFVRLLEGLWVSVRISLISVLISIVLGVLMGMLMTSRSRILKVFFRIYLEIVRIMPQMVLLFIVYFGTTRVFGWNLDSEASAIIVFSFWGTAEMGDLLFPVQAGVRKQDRPGGGVFSGQKHIPNNPHRLTSKEEYHTPCGR